MRAAIILLLSCYSMFGADWYVAKEAVGSNNGTSWANAWNEMNAVVWANINAGDTLWLSGGPAGGTNNYFTSLTHFIGSPNNGTPANPITIRVGNDSSHNGLVKIIGGGIYLFRDWYVVDGSKSAWIPDTVLDTYRIGTNCNIEVNQTNQSTACQFATAIGLKFKWVHVSASGVKYDTGIDYDSLSLGSYSNGTEIAYCWLTDAYGMALEAYNNKTATSPTTAASFGQLLFHHNLCERIHDNYAQTDGGVDFYKNVMRWWVLPSVLHPDGFQGIEQCVRIWNNIMLDPLEQFLYFECNDTDGTGMHDIYIWNNVFGGITNGTQFIIITGHDAEPETVSLSITNVWVANNTWINNFGTTVWTWNRGATRTSGVVSNLNFINNFIWTVAPNNTFPTLAFFTNNAPENGTTGFTYDKANVKVDYNNVSGGSGTGKGIFYGPTGDYNANAPYADMAAFASAIGYNSNNNLTATMVSVSNMDFRIGADLALKGNGTNLTSLTNLMPEINFAIDGTARPASGAWDIGAYQSDPTLKLWLSFNDWRGPTNIVVDDSGNNNNALLYGTVTNWPTLTNGPDGFGLGVAFDGYTTNYWNDLYPEPPGALKYFAVTNLDGIQILTNGTIAWFAWKGTNCSRVSYMFGAGYYDVDHTFIIGHDNWNTTAFQYYSNQVTRNLFGWPDSYIAPDTGLGYGFTYSYTNWAHYAVTWDGTNVVGYWKGVPFTTNAQPLSDFQITTNISHWLGIGTLPHQGTPEYGDETPASSKQPNAFWYGGRMDDIRIYNRALSAAEVANLVLGAGTSSPQQGGGGGGVAVINPTLGGGATISGGAKIGQ